MPALPTARSAMAVAAFGRRIYVMGGELPMLFDVNEVYDISTGAWSCQAPMPLPRHGIAAVTLDDRILAPAGGVVQGLQPTNAVDSFIPAPVPGDVTGDGFVDVADMVAVILSWGPCPDPPAPCPADLDQDGDVDVADLVIVVLNWG